MSGNQAWKYAFTLWLDETRYRVLSGGDMTYGHKWELEKLLEEVFMSGPVKIIVVKDRYEYYRDKRGNLRAKNVRDREN